MILCRFASLLFQMFRSTSSRRRAWLPSYLSKGNVRNILPVNIIPSAPAPQVSPTGAKIRKLMENLMKNIKILRSVAPTPGQ